jgi:hypothetical protein
LTSNRQDLNIVRFLTFSLKYVENAPSNLPIVNLLVFYKTPRYQSNPIYLFSLYGILLCFYAMKELCIPAFFLPLVSLCLFKNYWAIYLSEWFKRMYFILSINNWGKDLCFNKTSESTHFWFATNIERL